MRGKDGQHLSETRNSEANQFPPKLGSWDDTTFTSKVTFFNYHNQAHRILGLSGEAQATYITSSLNLGTNKISKTSSIDR